MVQCAALNCTVKSGQGLSMYLFPKEPHLRKIWTVKLKRDNFVPSDYTKLCERHFEKSQFVMNPDVAASVGFRPKSKMLVNGAIPTLFDLSDPKDKHGKRSLTQTQTSKPSRKSLVIEKRRRLEVISEVMSQTMCSSIPHEAVPIEHESGSVESDKPESQKTDANTLDIDSCSKMIQTTYNLVKRRHVAVQTTIELPPVPYVKTVTRAVQTDEPNLENNLDSSFMSLCDDDLTEDPDWNPEDEEDEGPEKLEDQLEVNAAKERKFIVYESCLDKLFKICPICNSACTSTKIVHGSYLKIKNWCENCNNMNTWESQPTSKSMSLGNLVFAGAVLFSGNSAHKFLTLCQHAAIQMFSIGTYNNIQKLYLVPTVESVWQLKQLELLDAARASGEPLRLGGDGRCCSPGHTAKYLSYTLMDLKANKIVDTQLVQKNEVKNSYAMELEGLKRGLAKLQEEQITISHLITDRHSQIKKYMRETHPNITHWFDSWHIAKGIYKKLEDIGKKKKCEVVGQWARSISNHTYWCAMSSGGNGELVVQKWCSILNHVCNVHEGHGPLFPKCEHGDVENRVWIKQGTKAYQELEKVVRGRLLMVDIKKISPAEQTSGLEAFHNVLCHFAPKLLHFFHAQMDARVKISALHFNENSNRQQATNQNGQPIYTVSVAKNRRGDGVAKEVKVKQTFDYIDELFEDLLLSREVNGSFVHVRQVIDVDEQARPLPLTRTGPCLNKQDIIDAHRSRFNK